MGYNDDKIEKACGLGASVIVLSLLVKFLSSFELAWSWCFFLGALPISIYLIFSILIPELLDIIFNSFKIDNILKYSDNLDIKSLKMEHQTNKAKREKLSSHLIDEVEVYIDMEKYHYKKEEIPHCIF
jgi:hypothetical protein